MQSASEHNGAHLRARIHYGIRTAAFAYSFIVLAIHCIDRDFGPFFWTVLALQFLVYPHLAYLRARFADDSRRAEEMNLYVDSAMLGAWVAGLQFPTWIAFAALAGTSLNAIAVAGAMGALWSIAAFGAAAALWIAFAGFVYSPETSDTVTLLCFIGSLAYACAVAWVVHSQKRHLAAGRDALRTSEERYRLIAENAGDLIAMVDQEGRWLYTSPSYERIFEPEILAPGALSFRRIHPDDAEEARVALLRAASTGRPRELALRLVDREGRMRRYKTHIQPLGAEKPAQRLLLVSQDVTDLRESEERLLVAAHALEGMTEGIMICAVDGTIVTVNRAFCEITGYTRDEVLGQSESAIRNALQPAAFYQDMYDTVARQGYWSGSTWARRKNGAIYREWRSLRSVRDAGGLVTHFVTVLYEVDGKGSQGQGEVSPQDLRG